MHYQALELVWTSTDSIETYLIFKIMLLQHKVPFITSRALARITLKTSRTFLVSTLKTSGAHSLGRSAAAGRAQRRRPRPVPVGNTGCGHIVMMKQ